MTSDQIEEWLKCRDDIEYFANAYIKLDDEVQCKLNDFQQRVVETFKTNKLFFMHGERIEGKTTIAAIILLHQSLFNEYRVSMVFARTKALSDSILKLIAEMYQRLPEFLRSVRITTLNKSKIEFDNMCSILSAGANADHGRGRAISIIYIDESEWVDDLDRITTMLYPCMATIPYSKIFALSSTKTCDQFRVVKAGYV